MAGIPPGGLGKQQTDDPKGIVANRNGVRGRLYTFSVELPFILENFAGATAKLEAFAPDSPNYAPVYIPPPLRFRGLQNLNGRFVPGQFMVNKGISYYPPTQPGQAIAFEHEERAVMATMNTKMRTYWTQGVPTAADVRIKGPAVPNNSLATEQVPQRHGHHQKPVPEYKFFNTNQPNMRNTLLPEKELVDGVWGYRLTVQFPEYRESSQGREYVVRPRPLENHWVPWNRNYRFYTIQPVDTFGYRGRHNLIRLGNKMFRYWPPRFPGQHVKGDWEQRVARADRGDQVEELSTPLPTRHDTKDPVPAMDNAGNVRGYTYTVSYPPLRTALPPTIEVGGVERKVLKNMKLVGTFPGSTSVFVPNREYYEPVTIARPPVIRISENYAPMPGQPDNKTVDRPVPENYQFLYFPPPKKGEKMDKLSDEYKIAADPKKDVRVYIMDTNSDELIQPPTGRNDTMTDAWARQRKSRKGRLGAQPSDLMKFAVLNKARQPPAPIVPVRAAPPPPIPPGVAGPSTQPVRAAPPPPVQGTSSGRKRHSGADTPPPKRASVTAAPEAPTQGVSSGRRRHSGASTQVKEPALAPLYNPTSPPKSKGPVKIPLPTSKTKGSPDKSPSSSSGSPSGGSGGTATATAGTSGSQGASGSASPSASGSTGAPTAGTSGSAGTSQSPKSRGRTDPALYPYTAQEAGSGPESEGESDSEPSPSPQKKRQKK